MNNDFKDIKPYLTETEIISIETINERIKSLNEKTTSYFAEFDSISLENIEEGYVRNSDLDALADKYVDLIESFQSEIKALHDEVEPSTINKMSESKYSDIGKENSQLIHGTISNFGKFFVVAEKLEALDLIAKVRSNPNLSFEETNSYIEQIEKKKEAIRKSMSQKNMVELKRISEDYEMIDELDVVRKDRRKKINWKQHLAIWISIIIAGVIVGVMIWAWT